MLNESLQAAQVQIENFNALTPCRGLIISMSKNNVNHEAPVRARILIELDTLYRTQPLHLNKIDLNLRKRIVKALVASTTLYGCETWNLKCPLIEKELNVFSRHVKRYLTLELDS